MFDIDTGKLLIVAVLALIVIGPKDLPRVLRQVGQAVGKLRRMSAEFQGQFMDAIKDAEIEDIRRELKDLEKTAQFDPTHEIRTEMTSLRTEVESAVQSVEAEASVDSPLKGFSLPPVPEELRQEAELEANAPPTMLAEGIAPVADAEVQMAQAEAVLDRSTERPKRKLFIKPHRSSFARMNGDRTAELTGQAIAVRQRLVRAKKTLPQDALTP